MLAASHKRRERDAGGISLSPSTVSEMQRGRRQVAGLTSRQHQALLAIKEFPRRQSVTIGELAEQLRIAHE
jgi:hypothetical protein